MASTFAASHSDGSFGHYMAPNCVDCGSTGSCGPRLRRADGSCVFFQVGPSFCLGHCWYLLLLTTAFLFYSTVSMEYSHCVLDEGWLFLAFKWTDSTGLRLAQNDLFALLNEGGE